MTREEAIKQMEEFMVIDDWSLVYLPDLHDALELAIEASREMSVEEYRQRLMEVFHRTDHDELLTYVVMPKDEEFKSLEDILRKFKFEPRLCGEWKPLGEPDDLGIHSWYICSRCGFRTTWHMVDIFHFCPNCGADMRTRILDESVDGEGKDGNVKEGDRNEY